MPVRIACVFAMLLILSPVAYADDTVYCPNTEAETKKECAAKRAYVKKAKALIAKWEQNQKRRATHSLIPWVKKSPDKYKQWAKPANVTLNEVQMPVYGTYRGNNNIVYLFVEDRLLKDGLWARYGNKVKVAGEFQKIRNNSNKIMTHRLPAKLAKYKQSLQKAQIFLAQCCGERWTTDGPGTSTPSQQGGSGNSNSINLLDVIADPAESSQ